MIDKVENLKRVLSFCVFGIVISTNLNAQNNDSTRNYRTNYKEREECRDTLNHVYDNKKFRGVVLNQCNFLRVKRFLTEDTCTFYQLKKSDIFTFEKAIRRDVKKREEIDFCGELKEYVRQYIGYTNKKREIFVYVFFLREPRDNSWKKRKVVAIGGRGCNKYSLKYNYSTQTFNDFRG